MIINIEMDAVGGIDSPVAWGYENLVCTSVLEKPPGDGVLTPS